MTTYELLLQNGTIDFTKYGVIMTKDEVLVLVVELLSLLDTSQDQQRLDIIAKLWKELPHSNIIDLIYQDMRNLTPEQVVEEAYRREAEPVRTSASH